MRKKSTIKLVLGIIFTMLILSSCMTFGQATTAESTYEFSFDLEELKEMVQSSSDECWKNPAQKRKNTICEKIDELQELIDDENFEEAYNKLLHDIKPKLTGLKTEENEVPWGNGVHNQPWVICESLQEEFRVGCNLILSEINPLSVYDDDKTPPMISIIYDGGYYVSNPGVWHVNIEDLESGLDEIIIEVNGIVEIHDTNLQGISSKSYEISVPAIIGINTIVVTATNNDKDFMGDQEIGTETEWVEIKEYVPPIIIITPEEKTYIDGDGCYLGTYNFETDTVGGDPAGWQVNDFYSSEIDIFEVESPHQKVIRIMDNEGGIVCETYTYFSSDQTSGTVEWWIMSSDIDSKLKMEFFSSSGYRFDVRIWDNKIRAAGVELVDFEIDTWYHIRVDFDCTTHTFDVYINGQLKEEDLIFSSNINSIFAFRLQTDFSTHSGPYYFDAFGYSWDDGYNIGDNTKKGLLLSFYTELELDWIGYSLDGEANKTILGNTTIPMSDYGAHTIQVFGNDSLGKMYESNIRNFFIDDDDVTGPVITIIHVGKGDEKEPGVWQINVEDLESGLDELQILVDGPQYLHDQNLNGIQSRYYEVSVPSLRGYHIVNVTAINNDIDEPGDQETSKDSLTVKIEAYIPPPPPIDL